MLIALSTESLKGYGLDRIFRFAKETGFDGIDLAMDPSDFDSMDADYIQQISLTYGIPVISIQTPQNTSKTKIEEAVRMAKNLEVRIVIIQPPKIFDVKLAKWLRTTIPKIRQKEKISIALENASSKTMLGFIPEHAMNSINELKKFKHACLDTSRVAEKKEDLIRVYSSLQKYLVHIHLSNVYRGKGYAPPETGILPLESFLAKLKQDEFSGAISLRVKPKNFHVGNMDKMMESLESSLKYCRKYLGS
ncbi:MAG: sugar phosphate isomerase/epimerase [Candidatus Peregrinibacteria bacterium]|nr:sugar phosphate isomerase/epimerase [Candidatus Peregrinibacteria bacterium]